MRSEAGREPPNEPQASVPEQSELDRFWNQVLVQLQVQMTAGTFNTWVRKTRLVARKENHFIVSVKNHYAKNWPEHRLATTIRRSLNNMVKAEPHAAPAPIEIDFVVEGQPAEN